MPWVPSYTWHHVDDDKVPFQSKLLLVWVFWPKENETFIAPKYAHAQFYFT